MRRWTRPPHECSCWRCFCHLVDRRDRTPLCVKRVDVGPCSEAEGPNSSDEYHSYGSRGLNRPISHVEESRAIDRGAGTVVSVRRNLMERIGNWAGFDNSRIESTAGTLRTADRRPLEMIADGRSLKDVMYPNS